MSVKFGSIRSFPIFSGSFRTLSVHFGLFRTFKAVFSPFWPVLYVDLFFNRFWYGGDGGNRNNFEDRKSCDEVCVDPIGRDACLLPKVSGPCEGYYPRWGYDTESKSCTQFIYGGCLGNNNRYETKEECEAVCVEETELVKFAINVFRSKTHR